MANLWQAQCSSRWRTLTQAQLTRENCRTFRMLGPTCAQTSAKELSMIQSATTNKRCAQYTTRQNSHSISSNSKGIPVSSKTQRFSCFEKRLSAKTSLNTNRNSDHDSARSNKWSSKHSADSVSLKLRRFWTLIFKRSRAICSTETILLLIKDLKILSWSKLGSRLRGPSLMAQSNLYPRFVLSWLSRSQLMCRSRADRN